MILKKKIGKVEMIMIQTKKNKMMMMMKTKKTKKIKKRKNHKRQIIRNIWTNIIYNVKKIYKNYNKK